MIKTVIIDDMDKAMKLVAKQKYNEEIGRLRSSYFFRGMVDADYKLMTSLRRNCKHLSEELEIPMLRNFTKYAVIDDPTLKDSVWKQMIIGQYHGLPTRLLDWSHSALVALHFATTEENLNSMTTHDCVVWRIDKYELIAHLPEKYRLPLLLHAINMRTFKTPMAAGKDGLLPSLEQFRKIVEAAAPEAFGAGVVRKVAITQATPA